MIPLIDLCIRLRLYRVGAWLCELDLARKSGEAYETLWHEMRATPVCAPVFEHLLQAMLRGRFL